MGITVAHVQHSVYNGKSSMESVDPAKDELLQESVYSEDKDQEEVVVEDKVPQIMLNDNKMQQPHEIIEQIR